VKWPKRLRKVLSPARVWASVPGMEEDVVVTEGGTLTVVVPIKIDSPAPWNVRGTVYIDVPVRVVRVER
jgi:hypothetical protein